MKTKRDAIKDLIKQGYTWQEVVKMTNLCYRTVAPIFYELDLIKRRVRKRRDLGLFDKDGRMIGREKDSCHFCEKRFDCKTSFENRTTSLRCDFAKFGCTMYTKEKKIIKKCI